jgi:hypothetical protein
LTNTDFDELKAFRHAIITDLEDPDFYHREDDENDFIASHLEGSGLSIGVFHEDRLIAYAALGLPVGQQKNLADLLGLAFDNNSVAHLSACMVARNWRGIGLQYMLARLRLSIARLCGRNTVLSIISPRNHVSWGNLLPLGLHVKGMVRLYEGVDRFVLLRDFETSYDLGVYSEVRSEDASRHRDLLANGLIGTRKLSQPFAPEPRLLYSRTLRQYAKPAWPVEPAAQGFDDFVVSSPLDVWTLAKAVMEGDPVESLSVDQGRPRQAVG